MLNDIKSTLPTILSEIVIAGIALFFPLVVLLAIVGL
jgi:hypothetical protein